MKTNKDKPFLTSFVFEGKSEPVVFMNSLDVIKGVVCDVYSFEDDKTKDLGIIKIEPGCSTPLQKVLQGEKTIEGYISGKGKLIVTRKDGTKESHNADGKPLVVLMEIGDMMQWQATEDSELIAYEVCFPPYEEGRFENIEQ